MISRNNIKDIYSLSPMQEGMLFHYIMNNKSTEFIEQAVFNIKGQFDVLIFEQGFNELIKKYDVLRSIFMYGNGVKNLQGVLKERKAKVFYNDISTLSDKEKTTYLCDFKLKDSKKEFDLKKDIPMRVSLIKTNDKICRVFWTFHHIVMDGWCLGILMKDFFEFYNGIKTGKQMKYTPVKQYSEYIKWLKKQDKEEASSYWENYLVEYDNSISIPKDTRIEGNEYIQEKIEVKINENLTNALSRLAIENQVTVNSIFQSIWGIVLSKHNNTEDVVFGTVVSGRPAEIIDIEKIVGLFINTIPIRVKYNEDDSFIDLLKRIQNESMLSMKYDYLSLSEIQSKSKVKQGLIDNIYVFENYPIEKSIEDMSNENGLHILNNTMEFNEHTNYNLEFIVMPGNEIEIKLKYNSVNYNESTIASVGKQLIHVIQQIIANPNIKIKDIDLLTETEKYKLIYEFNNTYADYSRDKTIQELFEDQVKRTPDNIAIVFEDKKLTYRELNERSNRLARTLREKGVKPDSIVGIMVERSLEMIVGIFGILKAGGAYLPIDPEYPEERIKYMLDDGKVDILLIQSKLKAKIIFKGEFLDLEDKIYYGEIVDNLNVVNSSRDLAYVIYTSGSTGKPKGVMIEHKNVLSLIFALRNDIYSNYGLNLNIALVAPYVFDASVQQIFPAILLGHKLFIIPEDVRIDGELLLEYYNNNLIDISDGTPVHINMLVNGRYKEDTSLNVKRFIIGGDVLPYETVRKFYEKFAEIKPSIVNIYGPTECCVDSIFYDIDMNKIKDLKIIPIGKPMSNESIYVLGKNLEILPIGIVGEIYIAGEGVGRGYLNRVELTAEKFIESPFVSGERMYRTGDLARWMPDGNIQFLGRIDNQVKIRGFRIELGEIESQLRNHELVKEAIILDREDENGTKYLCAYLVWEKELTVGELRKYLSKKLPEYMIPSYFVQLEKMPLTSNGKIDRKALPEPDGSIVTGAEYEVARNDVEEKLVAIWKDVLGTERVGINDNFFELGGHSLKATILVSKIHKELNVEVPLREIFKFPTIKGISEYIEGTEKSIYSSIEIADEKEYYEASSAQKRMYMLQQFDLKSTGYNMPGVMLIEGKLEAERLEKSFAELIRRHETLRTSFETIEDKIVQRVNESVNFKLDCFEVGFIESQEKAIDNIVKDFVKAFDLNKAPLLRVGLIKLEEDKHILMFDMHHIISDGVSMRILINEFAKIYEGKELEQLRIQYKDYSQWQNSLSKSEIMQEQKKYWVNRFSDEIPVLNMPTDFQRTLMPSFEGENISFKLDKELTKNLKRISKETGSTMYMVLLSGVNILLAKYSGQEDIIVGSPIAGRPHADLEKIIGMFVNTLAMRNHPEGNRTYEDFLKEVKENALKAYENQDYQFDELVDKLNIPRDISRNPLFDVMFTMQNLGSEDIELKDLIFKEYKQEHKVAKFDLTFSASEVRDEIIFDIEYSTKLFVKDTIEMIIAHLKNVFKTIANDKNIKLNKILISNENQINVINKKIKGALDNSTHNIEFNF